MSNKPKTALEWDEVLKDLPKKLAWEREYQILWELKEWIANNTRVRISNYAADRYITYHLNQKHGIQHERK